MTNEKILLNSAYGAFGKNYVPEVIYSYEPLDDPIVKKIGKRTFNIITGRLYLNGFPGPIEIIYFTIDKLNNTVDLYKYDKSLENVFYDSLQKSISTFKNKNIIELNNLSKSYQGVKKFNL